nr:hypothetical protein [Tanacetum cinerariifolium]
GNPQQDLKDKGVTESGCSRHMTRNRPYLKDYEEIVGGFVAFGERKNSTLIEATRTMLADLKLPTTFWAEAINTACYVQNRVLVIKPHNKTPYELFLGRKYSLSFMKPFGCPVTILNTIDHREEEKKDAKDPGNEDSIEEPRVNQEKDVNVNNTNNINTVSPTNNVVGIEDNAIDENIVYGCADDPNMPNLEDIVYSDDDEDVGVEADMNNLDAFMPISPIPTTRVHKDHSVEQIIRDLNSTPQTRRMTKNLNKHDPDFPDRVYKVEKALYRLHQAPRAWKEMCTEFEKIMHKKFHMSSIGELTFFLGLQIKQNEDRIFISQDKYVTEILNKFGFTDVKRQAHIWKHKSLCSNAEKGNVDEHLYRSMIGSLMYLTSSMPDIMFVVCACARYQVNPNVSHLHAVKRIFRYLKGQPKLGLWCPKDSPFDLVAYTDSDYAGVSLDRKSTNKGCQFLVLDPSNRSF